MDPYLKEVNYDPVDSLEQVERETSRPRPARNGLKFTKIVNNPRNPFIVFAGHSWVRRFALFYHHLIPDSFLLKYNLLFVYQTYLSGLLDLILEIVTAPPAIIHIFSGGNDLYNNPDNSTTIREWYLKLAVTLNRYFPQTKLAFSQIENRFCQTPVEVHNSFQKSRKNFNHWLSDRFRKKKWAKLFLVQAVSDLQYYLKDGVHLNDTGYALLAPKIVNFWEFLSQKP